MGKKKGIPGLSFSWKRATGISQAKSKVARKTGIPTSKAAIQRKVGKAAMSGCGGTVFIMLLLLIVSALTLTITADEKEKENRQKTYNMPFDVVWSSAIQVATEDFKIDSSDKNSGVLVFHSGRSLMSQSFDITATITTVEHQTKVFLKLEMRDGGYTMVEKNKNKAAVKFFKALEKRLATKN